MEIAATADATVGPTRLYCCIRVWVGWAAYMVEPQIITPFGWPKLRKRRTLKAIRPVAEQKLLNQIKYKKFGLKIELKEGRV
ncbi:unnamed protein product [Prunus armeniaca]|uniref:Uncharacterized protein n=1 Tax=Prunus armeniaca TaxID=36596 RepID=A0A6J5XKB2_PRUAR|nr:unnamed protein product [Prunus armeniaca]